MSGLNRSIVAIIPAAGAGSRLGELTAHISKALLKLPDGKSILEHTMQRLISTELFSGIVIACRESERRSIAAITERYSSTIGIVLGGETRQDSVYAALKALQEQPPEIVAVHDAARPFCSTELISKVVAKAIESGAAIAAVPVSASLKRVADGSTISESINRQHVWEAQTPQAFHFSTLWEAHQCALERGICGTDESELVQKLGVPVSVVLGSRMNIKITAPEDIAFSQLILR